MKQLGYSTAYFGKFELDRYSVFPKPGANYADALKRYGFDVWQPYGEVTGEPTNGYEMDGVIGAEGISWLRMNAESLRTAGEPWFLVLSFINPHDIFFANVNPPGESVQKSLKEGETAAIPVVFIFYHIKSIHMGITIVAAVVYSFSYSIYSVCLNYKYGGTLGKLAMGIRITKPSGEKIGLKEALLRSSVDIIYVAFFAVLQVYAMSSVEAEAFLPAGYLRRMQLLAPLYPAFSRRIG